MTSIRQVYPAARDIAAVAGIYLQEDLRGMLRGARPFVYTNYVTSLDGRIAVREAEGKRWHIPPAIETAEDRWLYFELAAQADVVIVTARHAASLLKRDENLPFPYLEPVDSCELKQWRLANGRSEVPALAVASSFLKFPGADLREKLGCEIHALTGSGPSADDVRAMEDQGVRVSVLGQENFVPGDLMVQALADEGYALQYSVAGPGVMNTLLRSRVLDRLYLTRVETLVGGSEFYTIFGGDGQALNLRMQLLAQYRTVDERLGQSFEVFGLDYD